MQYALLIQTKGTLKEKFYSSINIILIFILPYFVTFGNIEFFFHTFCLTISIGMLCELYLHYKLGDNFTIILILLVLCSFNIIPNLYVDIIDYKKVFICVLIISCMDTYMNIIGKYFVSKLPKYIPVFKYPKSVSGNKTILSVFLSLLLNIYVFSFLFEISIFNISDVIIISLLTAFGDALFSIYKRKKNIDDFSHLLGKIGGFCDRFDGWVLPFIYIFVM